MSEIDEKLRACWDSVSPAVRFFLQYTEASQKQHMDALRAAYDLGQKEALARRITEAELLEAVEAANNESGIARGLDKWSKEFAAALGFIRAVTPPIDVEKIAREANHCLVGRYEEVLSWDQMTPRNREICVRDAANIIRLAGLSPDPDLVGVSKKSALTEAAKEGK